MDKSTVAFNVRFPSEVYEVLRREAFDQHVAMNKLVVMSVAKTLSVYKNGKARKAGTRE